MVLCGNNNIAATSCLYRLCKWTLCYGRMATSHYDPNVAKNFLATIHRHPIIHRYNLCFHVYIWVLCFNCFDESSENSQLVFNNYPVYLKKPFLEINIYFHCCYFSTRCGSKISLMSICPPQLQSHLNVLY